MRSHKFVINFGAILSLFITIANADNGTASVWDNAPDFSKDQIQPYPSLKDANGANLTVDNIRGVHLFGWKGCETGESNAISEAYNDFYKLANQPEVYNKIDWDGQAAKDFFGPNSAKNKIPDDRRAQIQQIFASAQQVYSYPWTWFPPWLSPRQLWIEVRCSGGDNSGDPDNICGDRQNPPTCPPPIGGPPQGGTVQLQAYSDPGEKYSRITFCTQFFNLNSLTDAINLGQKKSAVDQNNLETWENRARTFFHEVTHLDYFMNAPSKSPYVSDTTFSYKLGGINNDVEGYGPFNAKVLRNYVTKNRIGYYTQRNADTYAWFAVAKYIQGIINSYPSNPNPGSTRPSGPPRDQLGKPLAVEDTDPNAPGDDGDLIGTQDLSGDGQNVPGFTVPGCGDKFGQLNAVSNANPSSISSAAASPTPPPPPYATGTCSFHLTETQNCDTNYGNNLYGNVKMVDNNKVIIGQTVNDNDHPIGYPMDDGKSYSFDSKLPHPLVITGEHENDYVQFTYGGLSWQSKTPNGGGSCTVGGWDPRDGPICDDPFQNDQNAVNNMDCSFPC